MSNVSVVFLNFIYEKLNYLTFHPTERVPFNKFLAIADVLKHNNILIRYSDSFRHIALYIRLNNICLAFQYYRSLHKIASSLIKEDKILLLFNVNYTQEITVYTQLQTQSSVLFNMKSAKDFIKVFVSF